MKEARTNRRTRPCRAALALILAGGLWAATGCARQQPSEAQILAHREERLRELDAVVAAAPPGFVFLAGDSFMELYRPSPLPCSRDIVNGGLGGAKAGDYLAALDRMRFRHKPAAVLVSIGLNDLMKSPTTGTAVTSLRRFKANAELLVRRLASGGAQVTVTTIPPIPARAARHFDIRAIAAFNDALVDICARRGCAVRDVFADARGTEPWLIRKGIPHDGLHLSDLAGYYRSTVAGLCR